MSPPDIALSASPAERLLARIPESWRAPLGRLAFVWLGLIVLFGREWAAMLAQWWNSSTYNHVLFIPLIVVWLVVLRAGQLARLRPMGWWPGLIVVAGALFLWLLGAFSGLDLAMQLGAVVVLQGVVLALLGPRVAAGLVFPLGYMLFLVPFGDELVPALQTITAKLTILFTHWSGIPADIQGVFIDTPVGLFEVAEACSGVKFLVAMIALGTLVAQICFTSWRRRALFMAMAVVVPVLANGVRAWGTIYIAQFRGVSFAAGFDHIIYGWVFFAIVMALMLAGAWRFFDRSIDDPFIDADAIMANPLVRWAERRTVGAMPALAAIAAMALGVSLWAAQADRLAAAVPHQIMLPEPKGWHEVPYRPQVWWEPRAQGANHRLLGRFADGAGHQVEVFYAFYASQAEGREAGGFGQGALTPDSAWSWLEPGPADGEGHSEWLLAQGHVRRLAITFYRSGDLLTGSNTRLKLANMRDRFLLARRPTMLLILSAEDRPGHPAAQSVAAFRKSAGPLGEWMDHIAKLP